LKWVCSSVLTLGLTIAFGSSSAYPTHRPDLFTLMAAAAGVMFACGVTMLVVTGYIYWYLSKNRE
jgi:uncharacterized iron-regulated membrane protein